MTLVSTEESKDTLKKHEELRNKIKDLIRLITNNPDNYDKKYKKIKFHSDDYLPLKKCYNHGHNILIIFDVYFNWYI